MVINNLNGSLIHLNTLLNWQNRPWEIHFIKLDICTYLGDGKKADTVFKSCAN